MTDRSFGRAIARIVRKRLRRLLRGAGTTLERGRMRDLHALRIEVKRLRYNLELIAPFARAETLAALDLLALLQQRLGTLADAHTFARTYAALQKGLAASDSRRAGIDALCASTDRDRDRALVAVRGLWLGETAPYPQRLAASISAALGSLSPKDEA